MILLSLFLFSLSSCGPSKAEAEATARIQAIQNLIVKADDQEEQDELKQQLINLKAKLAGEEFKLSDTEQLKLLHSQNEKIQKIETQTKIVEQIKKPNSRYTKTNKVKPFYF